jgi:hypothetical protein
MLHLSEWSSYCEQEQRVGLVACRARRSTATPLNSLFHEMFALNFASTQPHATLSLVPLAVVKLTSTFASTQPHVTQGTGLKGGDPLSTFVPQNLSRLYERL